MIYQWLNLFICVIGFAFCSVDGFQNMKQRAKYLTVFELMVSGMLMCAAIDIVFNLFS